MTEHVLTREARSASCSCGWFVSSRTEAGLATFVDDHCKEFGIKVSASDKYAPVTAEDRARFTVAQRRVLATRGVELLGIDKKNRPVVRAESGIPRQAREWAMLRNGDPTDIAL